MPPFKTFRPRPRDGSTHHTPLVSCHFIAWHQVGAYVKEHLELRNPRPGIGNTDVPHPSPQCLLCQQLNICVYLSVFKKYRSPSERGSLSFCSTRVLRIARRQVAGFGRPARNRLPTATTGFSKTSDLRWCLQGAAGLQSAGFPRTPTKCRRHSLSLMAHRKK